MSGERKKRTGRRCGGVFPAGVVLSYFLVEAFACAFLEMGDSAWPIAFGGIWAVLLGCLVLALPAVTGRILYGLSYFLLLIYAGFQTGYFILFGEMMWLSEFRYASEGADYIEVLLSYPALWWAAIGALVCFGVMIVARFPKRRRVSHRILCLVIAVAAAVSAWFLPETVFKKDEDIQYAHSDYGRMNSAQAAYENMFSPLRLYQVCGLSQTLVKDVYVHFIYPSTPAYVREQTQARLTVDQYFSAVQQQSSNEMTGLLAGKNVILVLMESMDDWMIGEHTPTITRMMEEGVNFTRFYTPAYGGIRTFNTEFCINTGCFLSSRGGYAFDYVTNHFNQSLAFLLRDSGYSALVFHYNDPSFYSRGVFSKAMGYEDYISYMDYETDKNKLYDDQLLFDDANLKQQFFREGPKLNFVITRSAHLSYKYNEVLSYWALKKYPEYKGLTGNEETDCALVKARLVDDFFARMLSELESAGELENTVIVAVTDHYTYGYKNVEELLSLSGVSNKLLLEKTPCFIWSPGLEGRQVDKLLNTSDLLPTLLNMLGISPEQRYLGRDAFDSQYDGFVPFSGGSWLYDTFAYDAGTKRYLITQGENLIVPAEVEQSLPARVQEFININNLILQTDYYSSAE